MIGYSDDALPPGVAYDVTSETIVLSCLSDRPLGVLATAPPPAIGGAVAGTETLSGGVHSVLFWLNKRWPTGFPTVS